MRTYAFLVWVYIYTAHIGDRAFTALRRDKAQEVHAGDNTRNHGRRAVIAARVGPLLRAHQREVIAVKPVRQLF